MAKSVRWRTAFRSVTDTLYTVEILDEGWTGAVTEFTPAADALTLDEDDDTDLLSVVRYTTGYVRVMATEDSGVEDIFPSAILDRPVRIVETAGGTAHTIFYGYVQVQEFNRYGNYASTGNPPDEVEIPIVSPLGLMYDIDFDKVTTFTTYSLLQILKMAMGKLRPDEGYSYAYFPEMVTGITAVLSSMYLPSRVISPLSDDNVHDTSLTVADCFKTESVGYYIEGLCRCFGLMVHETADSVLFTRVDTVDSYKRYDIRYNTVSSISAPALYTLSPANVPADGINITQIAPLRKLTCTYEGSDDTSLGMSFQHCRRSQGTDNYEHKYVVTNSPVLTPQEWTVPSYLYNSCTILENPGVPDKKGVYMLAYGKDSLEEMLLVCLRTGDMSSGHAWAADDLIAKYTFNGYFGDNMHLDFTLKWGGDMRLDNNLEDTDGHYFYMTVRNGSMYLNYSTRQWQSSEAKITINDVRLALFGGDFSYEMPALQTNDTTIEVAFYEYDIRNWGASRLLAITDIRLSGEGMSPAAKYMNEGKNRAEYVLYGNGTDEGDVTMAFNCNGMKNENMILPQTSFSQPRYPYMFRRRKQVSVTFQGLFSEYASFLRYAQRVRWKGTDMRVISTSLSAADGLVTIDMQTTQ